jgi:hypothetical protein
MEEMIAFYVLNKKLQTSQQYPELARR